MSLPVSGQIEIFSNNEGHYRMLADAAEHKTGIVIGDSQFLITGIELHGSDAAGRQQVRAVATESLKKEWNGEGLPPVGTVCEVQTWVNREWRKTTVLAHHLGFAVHSWSTDGDDIEVEVAPAGDFRPFRTPEQFDPDAAIRRLGWVPSSEKNEAVSDLLEDLRVAAQTLRRYEGLHRAKNTEESTAKAEANADLASRFEATIAKVQGGAQ